MRLTDHHTSIPRKIFCLQLAMDPCDRVNLKLSPASNKSFFFHAVGYPYCHPHNGKLEMASTDPPLRHACGSRKCGCQSPNRHLKTTFQLSAQLFAMRYYEIQARSDKRPPASRVLPSVGTVLISLCLPVLYLFIALLEASFYFFWVVISPILYSLSVSLLCMTWGCL